jgi:hypothetical protein
MYHNINSLRIDEMVEDARLVEEISIEKKKLEKKHHILLDDVNNWMNNTTSKVMSENFQKLKAKATENEEKNIKNELEELKQKEKLWEEEREGMKEEKKRLENMLYELFNNNASNKDKLKRIKQIMDE